VPIFVDVSDDFENNVFARGTIINIVAYLVKVHFKFRFIEGAANHGAA